MAGWWALGAVNLCLLFCVILRLRRLDRELQARVAAREEEAAATKRGHSLLELRSLWLEARRAFLPEIDADPLLTPPRDDGLDALLGRYFKAENGNVREALRRLKETAEWRRDYRCVDFHQPGMARRLFMHASNPGAAMYFADCGLRDRSGDPVLVGRNLKLDGQKDADRIVPATHIRAALLVIERVSCECRDKASYILDVGPPDLPDMAPVLAGQRYWDADGTVDAYASIGSGVAPSPSVGPHMPAHLTLQPNMPTLKEALRLMTSYYPELLHRVYFYRPNLAFQLVFAVFSMWLPASTRAKLVMVRAGEERRHFFSKDAPGGGCDPASTPRELGGTGPSLGGDKFLARAVDRYDRLAGEVRARRGLA